MSHTPGPWVATMHSNGWHVEGELIPDSFLPNRRKQIVFVGHMREADAKLIAAAPDLLEALERIAASYDPDKLAPQTNALIARYALKKLHKD